MAAAIDIVDAIALGSAAEQALTRWARNSRFAGSKDRAAVRDHVFDVLRMRQTAECFGGGTSGRALMIGLLRAQGQDPEVFFTGQGYTPKPLSTEERTRPVDTKKCNNLWNLPAELVPEMERSLGVEALPTAIALGQRAPITIRVNLGKSTRDKMREQLLVEGIKSENNTLCDTALTLSEGARKLRNSTCYLEGFVELQDAASQAVVSALPPAEKCLDFCAGGGGKALAIAAQPQRTVYAHDIEPARMADLAARADRAGSRITQLVESEVIAKAPFDLVLCDAPCSGSGAWRRSPDAKWRFSPERLKELCDIQDDILRRASGLIASDGTLVYATCSLLRAENEDRVAAFLKENSDWKCSYERRLNVSGQGDGFYTAHLTHA